LNNNINKIFNLLYFFSIENSSNFSKLPQNVKDDYLFAFCQQALNNKNETINFEKIKMFLECGATVNDRLDNLLNSQMSTRGNSSSMPDEDKNKKIIALKNFLLENFQPESITTKKAKYETKE